MGCGGSKPQESAPPPQTSNGSGGGGQRSAPTKAKPAAIKNGGGPSSSSPKKKKANTGPPPAGRPGPGSPPLQGKVGGPGERIKPPAKKPEITRKTQGKATKGAAIRDKKLKEEYEQQQRIQGDRTDMKRWKIKTIIFSGSAQFMEKGKEEQIKGKSIEDGIKYFKENPMKYYSMGYQTDMLKNKWPSKQHDYKLVHRHGTRGYVPKGVSPKGWMTLLINDYERCLPRYPNNELPKQYRDKYTDTMSYEGRMLHSSKNLPVMPGRGMGYGDDPSLKIIGDVDPSDISQGSVGDCWLLSAISALAEFDGGIKRLFRKTKNIDQMPAMDSPVNQYIITLYDLPTWKEVDIVIDERLCVKADGSGQLLGAGISEDGELWVCYLEKAIAAHCGGWDKIKGGQCTHAWAMLTGCKYQYHIMKNPKTGKYQCFGRYNPAKKEWAPHSNSPHDMAASSSYQMPWPKVGGGGGQFLEIDEEELFMKMCAWDDENYIVGAGTTGSSDAHKTDGMVDNHAYSVIQCINDVAGTDVDLIQGT